MRNYFDLVSKGAAKTKLFASTMANTLSNVLPTGMIHLLLLMQSMSLQISLLFSI
jgi:hypothetical protein